MATIQFKGFDEYMGKLYTLESMSREKVIGPAIYAGAQVIADAIRQELDSIPEEKEFRWATSSDPLSGPTREQKEGLKESLGVASIQTDGKDFVNVKVGFDGYNHIVTSRFPQGQPNVMVARVVQSGTSFMKANPFVKNALRKSRKAAVAAMGKVVAEEIEKIMK